MNWRRKIRPKKNKDSRYATAEDFCNGFREHLDNLFQLSYLLTGDQEKAEQCFVEGFEESIQTQHIFKEWVCAWAKFMIIRSAIIALQPHRVRFLPARVRKSCEPASFQAGHFDLDSVLHLKDFERFVFVLTVLDQYSDHDCSVLLNSPLQDIRKARARSFEQLVNSVRVAPAEKRYRHRLKDRDGTVGKTLAPVGRNTRAPATRERPTTAAIEGGPGSVAAQAS